MRFSEQFSNPYIYKPADLEAGADGDSVNMGKLHSIAYKFLFGAVTGDAVLKFYVGASAGTKTTAIAFKYRLASGAQGAASGDLWGAVTAVASTGLTLTAATFTTKQMIIEFDGQAIDDSTPWLTPELSAAASVLLVACSANGYTRDAGNNPATVI